MVVGSINEEEARIYDRQIRLWGVDSQNRLKNAKVLLLGMTPVSGEIAKNIVLAGIASLTIVDDQVTSELDTKLNFLIPSNCLGRTRAESVIAPIRELNPRVSVESLSIEEVDLRENCTNFDVIILSSECSSKDIDRWLSVSNILNDGLRTTRPYLVCVAVTGLFGLAFVDLGMHEFLSDDMVVNSIDAGNPKSKSSVVEAVDKKTIHYPPLADGLNFSWCNQDGSNSKYVSKGFYLMQVLRECSIERHPFTLQYLQTNWEVVAARLNIDNSILTKNDLLCCCGSLVPAVAAVLGGLIAQEVIRSITRKGNPQGNWYFFNGLECLANTEWIPCLTGH